MRWLTHEQTLITSSCGMNHLRRGIAFGKLKAMTGAKQIPARQGGEVGGVTAERRTPKREFSSPVAEPSRLRLFPVGGPDF